MDDDSYPPPLKIGIAYNLKKGEQQDPSAAEDDEAELDSAGTIRGIRDVFRSAGADTVLLEADADFVEKAKSTGADFVFNIAEGKNGRGREAQIPAILSFLGIPYSGSDETTLGLALDKAMTKRYLSSYGVRTPGFCLAESPDFRPGPELCYPLIVKPNSEGSGKGITDLAVVENEARLAETLQKDFRLYGEPMLIEEFVRGREFTVGLLGNGGGLTVFEPMEILYRQGDAAGGVYSYWVKTHYKDYVNYRCPAELPPGVSDEMKKTAALIYHALGCRDLSRIDFRLSEDGALYFIEINPLPGLASGYSDFPILAQCCGVDYRTLILRVLQSALARYGMNLGAVNRGDLQ